MTIKELRELTNLSQVAFAKKYNISRRTLEDWEYNKRTPPAYIIELLEFKVKADIKNSTESNSMTVEEFFENYGGGNACISIEGYCEEETYDYYHDVDDELLSDDNPNHYKPTCLAREPWWNDVKDKKIEEWNVISGPELWVLPE